MLCIDRGQLLSFLTGLCRWCHLALTVHLWDGHKSKGPMALEMNFCSNQEKGPEFFKNNCNLLIYLFIYDRAGSLLLHRLFSTFGKWGRLSSCGSMQRSH